MTAFAKRWLSGDERTLGAFLVIGVLIMAFFRLDQLRDAFGGGPATPLVVMAAALAWWSLLPRSFVWLDPADLTWRDPDRVSLIAGRLVGRWLGRLLALGYVLALLAAVARGPAEAPAAVLLGAGLLALAVVRRPRTAFWAEALTVLATAAFATAGPTVLFGLAGALAVAGAALLRFGTPPIANATRQALVDGWRDRVLRVSGVQFLDLALLLPAARPTRPHRLTSPAALALTGVLGRARHLPTAVLLGLTAVAAHRSLPALPDLLVGSVLGYLALVPLTAGLGELWRSPGRRRWVGATDLSLRWHHFLVATALAAAWALPVCLLGGLAPATLATIPVLSAAAVRTMTRNPPTYDNLMPVDTPFGMFPARLALQTTRGPDLGVLAVLLMSGLPSWGVALVTTAAVAVAILR